MSNYACTGPNDREDTELILLDSAMSLVESSSDVHTTWRDRLRLLDHALSYYGCYAGPVSGSVDV